MNKKSENGGMVNSHGEKVKKILQLLGYKWYTKEVKNKQRSTQKK